MKFAAFGLSFLLLVPGYMAKANRILTEAQPAKHVGGDEDRITDGQPGVHLNKVVELMDGETEEEAQWRACTNPTPEWPLLCASNKQCCNKEYPWCCGTYCCARGSPYCGKDGRCYAECLLCAITMMVLVAILTLDLILIERRRKPTS